MGDRVINEDTEIDLLENSNSRNRICGAVNRHFIGTE